MYSYHEFMYRTQLYNLSINHLHVPISSPLLPLLSLSVQLMCLLDDCPLQYYLNVPSPDLHHPHLVPLLRPTLLLLTFFSRCCSVQSKPRLVLFSSQTPSPLFCPCQSLQSTPRRLSLASLISLIFLVCFLTLTVLSHFQRAHSFSHSLHLRSLCSEV